MYITENWNVEQFIVNTLEYLVEIPEMFKRTQSTKYIEKNSNHRQFAEFSELSSKLFC